MESDAEVLDAAGVLWVLEILGDVLSGEGDGTVDMDDVLRVGGRITCSSSVLGPLADEDDDEVCILAIEF